MSTISTTVTTPVIVGSVGYPSPLTITETGVVAPTTSGAIGVYENGVSFSLTNQGAVDGGAGSTGTQGGTGGIGVDLVAGTVSNGNRITGGSGGTGNSSGGAGGVGARLTGGTLTNAGTITGGTGGTGSTTGGNGGAGVFLDGGTLTTSGTLSGGRAGSGASNGTSGDAVRFGSAAGTLVVEGGAVFSGGIGAFGLSDTIDITNLTPTQVAADFNPTTQVLSTTGDGTLDISGSLGGDYFVFSSDGGTGTDITLAKGSGISTTVTSTVTLGSTAHPSPLTITNTGAVAPSAAGATGVISNISGNALTNNGVIRGGVGSHGSVGGSGGMGLNFEAPGTVTNTGTISGGSGGTGSNAGSVGGVGINLLAGQLTNTGTITGGTGGAGTTSGGTGGAGVYLNGGTLSTAGTISGGQGGSGTVNGTTGDAVLFGPMASTLIVDPGALFNGQVIANASVNDTLELSGTQSGGTPITLGSQFTNFSTLDFAAGASGTVDVGTGAASSSPGLTIDGFAANDTIDVTNLTPTQVAGDFNSSSYVLSAGGDGTLNFSGSFLGEYFAFSSDGSTGTDISLAKSSGISTTVTTTVIVGSAQYPSPLNITDAGVITPTAIGAAGVYSDIAGNIVTNHGTVRGGPGSVSETGGIGVNFEAAATLTNAANIVGGIGAAGVTGSYSQYTNGGTGGAGGLGGTGVYSSDGTLTNTGSITGGAAGRGGAGGGSDTAEGGLGGIGAVGGVGVDLLASTLTNNANITGGAGGTGGVGGTNSYFAGAPSGTGGAGGTGVRLNDGTVTNGSNITGGSGGAGGPGSSTGGDGATGGVGAYLNGGTLTNDVTITGGAGGTGGSGGYWSGFGGPGRGYDGGAGGTGGVGVYVLSGTLTNSGSIAGGTGAAGGVGASSEYFPGGGGSGGNGGNGVFLNGGVLITSGTIAGGTAGAGAVGGRNEKGGHGARGHNGALGNAVRFGTNASTLDVKPGAVFDGRVLANTSVNDVLELSGTQSGGTPITLGTQFINFSTLEFDAGASGTVDIGTGAASTSPGLTVDGFAASDTIDVTNLTPTQVAGDFNPTTNVLSTAGDGTLNFSGSFVGDYFVFSTDGSTGTDITLAAGSGISTTITAPVTIGSGGYPSPLTVTNTGAVEPATTGANGIYENGKNFVLTNHGTIDGGAGSPGAQGGTGGAGVDLLAGAANNSNLISGGNGGAGSSTGGNGGVGVHLLGGALTNTGSITGGYGGTGDSTGGNGGAAVFLDGGTLTTSGTLSGGRGGSGASNGTSGDAVRFGSVASTMIVQSGAVFNGAIVFGLGDTIDITNLTPTQVAGGFNSNTHVLTTAGDGTLDFTGSLSSNYFLFSSDGGTGTDIALVAGSGISSKVTTTVTVGSASHPSPLTITSTGLVAPAIAGATGVISNIATNSLTNNGAIRGGVGTTGSAGGTGGLGVNFTAGALTNTGTITGGAGGAGSATGGNGGSGVLLNGGTLTTSGTISGGSGGSGSANGAAGDAVLFGARAVASTLNVDPGAVFHGQVVANNIHDVLELSGAESGGTPITLGTQFNNFSTLEFVSGAAWTVDATKGDLTSHMLTIEGFGVADTLDITNLAAAGASLNFNATTEMLAITNSATTINLGFTSAFTGEHFVFTPNGIGGDLTLQANTPSSDLSGHGFSSDRLTDHGLVHAASVGFR